MIPTAAARGDHRVRLSVFTSLRQYRRGWVRGDAVAGLTVWAVLVPEALAYASSLGSPPWSDCMRRQAR